MDRNTNLVHNLAVYIQRHYALGNDTRRYYFSALTTHPDLVTMLYALFFVKRLTNFDKLGWLRYSITARMLCPEMMMLGKPIGCSRIREFIFGTNVLPILFIYTSSRVDNGLVVVTMQRVNSYG